MPQGRLPGIVRVGVLLVLLVVAACGRQTGDPADLLGTWRSDLPPATLKIGPRSFRLQSGDLTKWGVVERTPFRVAFLLTRTSTVAFKRYCRDEVDVYDWGLDDGVLRFRSVSSPCDRAALAVLEAAPWTRVPG
jgi:hypothetical protein